MSLPEGPTVLPFKSEKLSFSLKYKNEAVPSAQVELACVCFDRQAQVLDFVQFNRRAALNSALKHSACSYLPPKDAVPGADEAIHMYPFDFSPQCEVMLLLASAPRSPFMPNDLSTSGTLQFRVHVRELGAQAVQLLEVDLAPLAHLPTAGAGPLSNGHQTMVIAGVYTTPQGWTLSFDCSTFPEDQWGLVLPQLRTLLQRWPMLSAAAAAAAATAAKPQILLCSRKGDDNTLGALAASSTAAVSAAVAPSSAAAAAAVDVTDPADAGAGVAADSDSLQAAEAASRSTQADAGASEPTGDAPGAAAAAAAGGGAAEAPDRLVLELGWDTFQPRVLLDDEEGEEEEPVVEFAFAIYNLQGEELGTISVENPEFEGVTVEEEPEAYAEDVEKPTAPEQPQPASSEQQQQEVEGAEAAPGAGEEAGERPAAEAEGSGAAAGADGDDDDGFVKEDACETEEDKEASPEDKAAKAAAAAEAAAAAAQRAAANQRPLTEKFPLKRRVHLTLPELPPDARAMVLTMSSFNSSGFKNVKTLQARLLVAPPKQEQQEGQPPEEGQEEEEEEQPKRRKGPQQPIRVLAHYRFDSVQGADAHLTQMLVLKLYKEYSDSAFAVWAQHKVPDAASLLGGAAAVKAAGELEAAVAAAAGTFSCEDAKAVLQEVLAARKKLEADLAARRAKAAEEGLEEDEEEGEYDLRLARAVWRVRVLGLSAGGDSAEDLAPTVTNLLAYDGDLDPAGQRSSTACKVAFSNRDTYFGSYAAGAKSGVGLYVGANGASYVGQYAAGKRCGFGLMILPDGGMYKGGFKDDRFEGQGSYQYPDGSWYTGGWKAGKKHGQGTYWDKAGGCLHGSWAAGHLKGQAQYDQPHYHFEGHFAKGLPAGACSFSMSSDFRTSGLPQAAASYIIAPQGPTLRSEGAYALPAGVADDKAGEADAVAEEAEAGEGEGEEGAALPAWPKFEGLTYQSGLQLPCSTADIPFPPASAVVAAI